MIHHLVITAVGSDRPGIGNRLTKAVTHSGCNIIDSRWALFGKEFTLIMLVSGDMNAITKTETLLPSISSEHDLMVIMKRTAPHQPPLYTYKIDVSVQSDDKLGLTDAFTQFFSDHDISIAELSAQTLCVKSNDSPSKTPNNETNRFIMTMSGLSEVDFDVESLQTKFNALCISQSATGSIEVIANSH
ncbi:glycine cleavage system protein R [Vibrio rumoiensis]|uniref:Glycine cleavage system transcriptional repressor n=1 Tax=Vibrio rumoiensis 1S-45 TaxID=1188252 RepID=A0A1E5E0L8_9VIBR|nr:ACT domain-containing protein [Vibrio rumoiensis]OEF23980.1 glycine cleavage system transcriptional repressor [Vibrio rumoiensis 1S-45]